MPRVELHLDQRDLAAAVAFWIDQGCPDASATSQFVSFSYVPPSRDPRESSVGRVSATYRPREATTGRGGKK